MEDPLVALIHSMTRLRRELRELNDLVQGVQDRLAHLDGDQDDQGPGTDEQESGDQPRREPED